MLAPGVAYPAFVFNMCRLFTVAEFPQNACRACRCKRVQCVLSDPASQTIDAYVALPPCSNGGHVDVDGTLSVGAHATGKHEIHPRALARGTGVGFVLCQSLSLVQ